MTCINKDMIPAEHEEEIAVLKSIFNDDFLSTDDKCHPTTFDLIINFESLTNQILLIHEESNASSVVSHLPPITFRVTYPLTYPKIDPPLYCILCDYLTCDQLLALANQIDEMWIPGEVIVYTWIEFIKDYFYNLNNKLILRSIESSIEDKRFVTNYNKIGSKGIYEQLIEYNRMQNQQEFRQTIHTCPICLEEKSGKDCLQFETCQHYACLSCLNSHGNEYLLNSQENKSLNCYQCNSPLYLSELRRIFSNDKLLLKYQQRLLEQTVDMVWCPRCQHSIICLPSESTSGNHPSFVECFHCQFAFCRRCQQSWHPQIRCPKEEMIQNLIQNQNKDQPQLNKIELKKLLVELENIQTIEECSKPCPSCNVRIEKNGGCQHMSCRACTIQFCWTCGWYAPRWGVHPCNPLPEKSQASLPSDMTEKIDLVLHSENGEPIKHSLTQRVQLCPKEDCRQMHVKLGKKNKLNCEKCGTMFCFLCGEAIYGDFHFSEYGCKPNTRLQH